MAAPIFLALLSRIFQLRTLTVLRNETGDLSIRPLQGSYVILVLMKTSDLKTVLDRIPRWPKEAQEEALQSLQVIEEDFVPDAELAADLSRPTMRYGAIKESHRRRSSNASVSSDLWSSSSRRRRRNTSPSSHCKCGSESRPNCVSTRGSPTRCNSPSRCPALTITLPGRRLPGHFKVMHETIWIKAIRRRDQAYK